jgi:hypothetical protein
VLLWGSRERNEESVLYNPKGEPRQGGAVIGVAVGAPLSLFAVSHGTVYIDIAAIVVLGIETATVRCASRSQTHSTVYTFGSGVLGLLASASTSSRCPRRMTPLLSGGIQPLLEHVCLSMQGFAALGQDPVRQAAEVQVPTRLYTLALGGRDTP